MAVSTNCHLIERIFWRLSAPYKTHPTLDHQLEDRSFHKMASNLRQEKGVTQVIITISLLLYLMELISQLLVIHVVILISMRSSLTRTRVKVVVVLQAQVEAGLLSRLVRQHSPLHTTSKLSDNHHQWKTYLIYR